MLFFKSADKKFEEIGFKKIVENSYGVEYQRNIEEFGYTQSLHLVHKQNGHHIVRSYDPDLMDEKKIGNIGIGLTMYELKLCLQKMKEMKWKMVK